MNLELLNILIVGIGLVMTLLINWEKLIAAPQWLVGFIAGSAVGFAAAYLI